LSQPYDQPLPGFDAAVPTPARVQSAKDRDDAAHKVTWRKYKGAPRGCQDCFDEIQSGTRNVFGRSVFIRAVGGIERPICYEHKALRDEQDAISAPKQERGK